MINKIFCLILILILAGCSYKTKEYYFDSDKTTNGWIRTFIPGKDDTKIMGYSDSVSFKLNNSSLSFDLKVNGYQDTSSVGIIFPLIPISSISERHIGIWVTLDTNKAVEFDIKNWTITNLETNKSYKALKVWNLDSEISNMKINESGEFFIYFPIKAAEVSNFKLEFRPIKIDNKMHNLPPLYLKKKRGKNRFGVMSA